jgi:hypothetical protein
LQLHKEARNQMQGKANVSMQDIELHRRLLQVFNIFSKSYFFTLIKKLSDVILNVLKDNFRNIS